MQPLTENWRELPPPAKALFLERLKTRQIIGQLPGLPIPARLLVFHGRNELFRLDESPQAMISGPAETGKTMVALALCDFYARTFPGAQGALVRQSYKSMPGSVLQTFEKKILPTETAVKAFGGSKPEWYDYPNGARIWIGGMDNPNRVLSSERDFIYVNQAEELTEADWETLSTRATGRAGNMPFARIFGDCNPGTSFHWIKQKEKDGTLKLFESRHEDNPTLHDQVTGAITEQGRRTLAVLDNLTGVRYLRLRKGVWASAEGVVYEGYDRAVHYIARPPTEIKYYVAGVDWGFTNPGVIQVWGVDGDKRMSRVYEVYRTRETVDGFWLPKMLELHRRFKIRMFVPDPSQPTHIQSMRNAGLPVSEAFNDIKPGIENVQERLRVQADGLSRLHLIQSALESRDEALAAAHKPTCTEEEIEAYVWPKAADGKVQKEVPVDDNNHGLDALRYVAAYLDNLGRAAPGKIISW